MVAYTKKHELFHVLITVPYIFELVPPQHKFFFLSDSTIKSLVTLVAIKPDTLIQFYN